MGTKPTNIIWGAASAMSLRNWIWYQLNHTTAILEYSTLAIPKKGSITLKLSADGGFTPGWYGSDGSGGSRWVKVGQGGSRWVKVVKVGQGGSRTSFHHE